MLKTNTMLSYLLLGYNKISDQGVEALTNVLTRDNTTLKWLSIDNHKLVSDLSVDFLVEMLKHNQTLAYLYIDECSLSEKGKTKLQQITQSKKDFELIT